MYICNLSTIIYACLSVYIHYIIFHCIFSFFFFFLCFFFFFFFFSSRRRHTRWNCDWSSDVCSSDLQLSAPSQSFPVELSAAQAAALPSGPALLICRRQKSAVSFLPNPAPQTQQIGRASCRERV